MNCTFDSRVLHENKKNLKKRFLDVSMKPLAKKYIFFSYLE